MVHIDLLRDQSLEEFLTSLERFLACRERSEEIYLDNFSTFVAASKWLNGISREEKIYVFLTGHHVKWKDPGSLLGGSVRKNHQVD